MLEVPVATLIDTYGIGRKKATSMIFLLVILIGLMLFYHIIKCMIPIILFVNLVISIAGVME